MAQQFRRDARVELAPLEAESILFDPQGNKFLVLNGTSSFLWDRLTEPCTASALAQAVCERFDGVAFPDALHDVEQILEEMLSHDLLVEVHSATT